MIHSTLVIRDCPNQTLLRIIWTRSNTLIDRTSLGQGKNPQQLRLIISILNARPIKQSGPIEKKRSTFTLKGPRVPVSRGPSAMIKVGVYFITGDSQ
jgi:hypothetical protein